ncbi:MAG TPA: signal peptide peptidase SppA [Mycobacteriales bacterium]|nr:signal peptide peptidase SppA [Mycobacteriales bacterium]
MTGSRVLLELDLTEPPLEAPPADPLGYLQARRRPTLRGVVDALRDAAADDRVAGLVARVGGARLGLARAQELRAAVRGFAASGKPAVAWAETFGEGGPGTVPYLLATGFGQIWLQPSGDLGLTGVVVEATFLRGALDKVGLEPQLAQRHEYKNAVDQLTRHGFTDAYREAAARLAASAAEQVVAAVAEARGLTEERVRELVDRAPLSAREAADAGLVDRVGYRDEVYADVRRRVGDAELLFLARYRKATGPARLLGTVRRRRRKVVAQVTVAGAIQPGRSRRTPLAPGPGAGSDTVTAALRAAGRDDSVGAVVLRVDSPGGSYVASDSIWREVTRLRAGGKPVVASMGDVAASGGYFVAMAADTIVAQPGTLTGSIGVFSGKVVTAGLLERLGVGTDAVVEGRQARMFSSRVGFDAEQWQRLEEWLDRVYADFVGKVAQARSLSRERAHELARGRVWTGADAYERGLVDELGGLDRAAQLARQRAGLPADAEVRRWPPLRPADRLSPPRSSEHPAAANAHAGWGALADVAARLGLPPAGPLTMPPLTLR